MTPEDLKALCKAIHWSRHESRGKRCDGANALKRLRQRVGPVEVEKGMAELRKAGRV
jgi:hypothetical protein